MTIRLTDRCSINLIANVLHLSNKIPADIVRDYGLVKVFGKQGFIMSEAPSLFIVHCGFLFQYRYFNYFSCMISVFRRNIDEWAFKHLKVLIPHCV